MYTEKVKRTSNKLSEQVSCVLILHLKLKHTLHKLVFYLKRIQRFRIAYVLMCIECRLLVKVVFISPCLCVQRRIHNTGLPISISSFLNWLHVGIFLRF